MVGAAGPALKDLPSPWSCGSRDSPSYTPKGDSSSSSRCDPACAPSNELVFTLDFHGDGTAPGGLNYSRSRFPLVEITISTYTPPPLRSKPRVLDLDLENRESGWTIELELHRTELSIDVLL